MFGITSFCGFVFLVGFAIKEVVSVPENITTTPVKDTVEEIRKPKQTSQSTPSIRPALIAPARIPLEGDVTIEVNVTELPNKSVQVHGMTNLPTGTDLMLSIIDTIEGDLEGQLKCSVAADGSFEAGPFTAGDGFEDGIYVVEVLMPIPPVQPDNVKKFLGEGGEKLTGPLVEKDSLGDYFTVSTTKEFTIGGAQAAQAQHERLEERIKEYEEWVKKIVALHTRLQAAIPSRQKPDAGTFGGEWNKFGQEFAREVQSLKDKALQMPLGPARMSIYLSLENLRRMFHTTAFEHPQEYKQESTDYVESHEITTKQTRIT